MFHTYRKVLVIAGLVFCLFSSVSAYSGGSGTAEDPYQIADTNDLLALGGTPTDYNQCFILTTDINMAGQVFTRAIIAPDINSSSGFQGTSFNGIFDGNEHSIISLTIEANSPGDYLGLFGQIGSGGFVKNLGIEDVNITGGHYSYYIGGLCGYNYYGNISNCYSTGNVSGYIYTGGLCGRNFYGSITDCYSTGTVSGYYYTGGLCGLNDGGSISNCYSTGNASGSNDTGGLCGRNNNGTIHKCYTMGNVSGRDSVGGFCGYNDGIISKCYSNSSVIGSYDDVGGLCGRNGRGPGQIFDSYSTGDVKGDEGVGGLCGRNYGGITNCYSTGNVTGNNSTGGLCGANYRGSITSCYFLDTAGPDNGLGEPLTDEQMKQQASFIGWDFSYTDGDSADWFIQIDEYPILTWQISPADIYTDGKNNFRDFAVFAQYWMREDCAIYNYYCDWADMDFNGSVDIDDLVVLMSYWLESGIYE